MDWPLNFSDIELHALCSSLSFGVKARKVKFYSIPGIEEKVQEFQCSKYFIIGKYWAQISFNYVRALNTIHDNFYLLLIYLLIDVFANNDRKYVHFSCN